MCERERERERENMELVRKDKEKYIFLEAKYRYKYVEKQSSCKREQKIVKKSNMKGTGKREGAKKRKREGKTGTK